jgi:hypothetical protein
MANHNLSKEQVRDLVYSYDSAEVTNQLYKFGETALGEIDRSLARINSRAIAVLGWSTAILAFFLVGINRASSGVGVYFLLASSVFSIVAVLCSFNALRTRGDWKSPSDESWIHQSALVREDELKRYHIRVLHDVKRWRLAITNAKSVLCSSGKSS